LNKSLDDVGSCVLLPAEVLRLTWFLSIHSGDKQWKAILRDVAAVSKTKGFLPA
jgi:hypothetical protein